MKTYLLSQYPEKLDIQGSSSHQNYGDFHDEILFKGAKEELPDSKIVQNTKTGIFENRRRFEKPTHLSLKLKDSKSPRNDN